MPKNDWQVLGGSEWWNVPSGVATGDKGQVIAGLLSMWEWRVELFYMLGYHLGSLRKGVIKSELG